MTLAKAVRVCIAKQDVRRTAQTGRVVGPGASYKLERHVLEDSKISAVLLHAGCEPDEGDRLGDTGDLTEKRSTPN